MAPKALDLFQAYTDNNLPKDGGYIVSSFFDSKTTYSIYEVVAYSGVKNLYLTEEGLTFQTDGNKLSILVEPATYPHKYIEPIHRDKHQMIPHRFKEVDIIIAKNQSKIMIGKKPIITYSSFTILKPTGINFSLVFLALPDVFDNLQFFFNETLNKEAGTPSVDAKKASRRIVEGVKQFAIW